MLAFATLNTKTIPHNTQFDIEKATNENKLLNSLRESVRENTAYPIWRQVRAPTLNISKELKKELS